ncbi:hypothetical protein ACQQ2Q_01745 [Agrobacterium sp. ES01]|uniref:hypothetical protein n=1 Tax=Agrobacterium sp. ES01 TaxID=3420714 RepID=UPI003D14D080
MMVVDTSVWINFLNGREDDKVQVLLHHDAPDAIVVGDLILMEKQQGARIEERAAFLDGRLRRFKLAPMLKSGARPQIRLELQNTTPKRTYSPSINGRNHWHILHRT